MSLILELLKNVIKRPVTSNFPASKEGLNFPERLRGHHIINQDLCIGCKRCQRVCPAFAIEMVPLTEQELETRTDKKKFKPIIKLSDCIFCGECETVCPKDALHLQNEFVPASSDPSSLIVG